MTTPLKLAGNDDTFVNITINDSDSLMTMEIPEDILNNDTNNPNRNRIHVGGRDFQFLENHDMDRICVRVCIVADKQHDT